MYIKSMVIGFAYTITIKEMKDGYNSSLAETTTIVTRCPRHRKVCILFFPTKAVGSAVYRKSCFDYFDIFMKYWNFFFEK